LNDFAEWLSTTGPSVFIKTHEAWLLPAIQSIHILGIGIVIGSVFLICMRVLGVAAMDQTVRQVNRRFFPWLHGALWVLLATGLILIVGEPPRELISFSFWAKMTLLVIGLVVAVLFSRTVRRHEEQWDEALIKRGSVKAMAVGTLVIWLCIIVLGRLIAYDHIWGPLSPATQY
jgi:Ca2+/Na+ antiporter